MDLATEAPTPARPLFPPGAALGLVDGPRRIDHYPGFAFFLYCLKFTIPGGYCPLADCALCALSLVGTAFFRQIPRRAKCFTLSCINPRAHQHRIRFAGWLWRIPEPFPDDQPRALCCPFAVPKWEIIEGNPFYPFYPPSPTANKAEW
jgi:hypothetical protein